jgi:hypothetical protein
VISERSRKQIVLVLRRRPYGSSEVIHRSGAKAWFELLERERRQIVNNFAPSAPPDYELSSSSADESDETFEPGGQA